MKQTITVVMKAVGQSAEVRPVERVPQDIERLVAGGYACVFQIAGAFADTTAMLFLLENDNARRHGLAPNFFYSTHRPALFGTCVAVKMCTNKEVSMTAAECAHVAAFLDALPSAKR